MNRPLYMLTFHRPDWKTRDGVGTLLVLRAKGTRDQRAQLCFLMLGPGEDQRNPADLLFIAGVFQSSCKKSIPYVSGGVVFLGHSLLISSSSFSNIMALILCRISLPTITTHSSAHCQHEEQLVNGWDPRRHFGPVVRKLYFLFIPFEIIFFLYFFCLHFSTHYLYWPLAAMFITTFLGVLRSS